MATRAAAGRFGENSPAPSGRRSVAGKVMERTPKDSYQRGYAQGTSPLRWAIRPLCQGGYIGGRRGGHCIPIAKGEGVAVAWVHPRQAAMARTRKGTQHRQVQRHRMSWPHNRQPGDFGNFPGAIGQAACCREDDGTHTARCIPTVKRAGHIAIAMGDTIVMPGTPQR